MINTELFNPSDYGFESYAGTSRKTNDSDYIIVSKGNRSESNLSLSLSKSSTETIVNELGEYVEPMYNKETGAFCIVKGNKKISKNRKGGRGTISINKLRNPIVSMHGEFYRIYLEGSKFGDNPAFIFKPNGERD